MTYIARRATLAEEGRVRFYPGYGYVVEDQRPAAGQP